MDLNKHFLQQDLHKALDETICINNCGYLLEQALNEGNFKRANFAIENISRSVKELEELNQKKIARDHMELIAQELRRREVIAERVLRRIWDAI